MSVVLQNISKIFETSEIKTNALEAITLSLSGGQITAIEGPSGCGKSTLLSIIGTIDAPTGGTVTIDGVTVDKLGIFERSRFRNAHIGFVFQGYNLVPTMTIAENVGLPLKYARVSRDEREGRVCMVLSKLGVLHRLRHYPHQLSGGEQQRVAIARAVINDASVIVADEPTGNLDTANGDLVMDLMESMRSMARVIVVATHNDRISGRADQIIRLEDGRVIGQ